MATHSSVLAWRIPGMGSLVGCHLWVAQSRTRLKRLSSSSRAPLAAQKRKREEVEGRREGGSEHLNGSTSYTVLIIFLLQCMKVKSESEVAHLCPTLRDPMNCSLPGSSIHGIFQAGVLEWGAIAFSESSFTQLQNRNSM